MNLSFAATTVDSLFDNERVGKSDVINSVFCGITQQYHEKSVYILVAVIVVFNTFQFYLAIGFSFQCNFFDYPIS